MIHYAQLDVLYAQNEEGTSEGEGSTQVSTQG